MVRLLVISEREWNHGGTMVWFAERENCGDISAPYPEPEKS